MRTVGIDLAAEPGRTAVAVLDWQDAGAVVTDLLVGADDDALIERVVPAAMTGIDCPFGWPLPFVELIAAHARGTVHVDSDTVAARRPLVYRATDLWCIQRHGLRPLSVAADLIGHPALRCAGLLAKLAARGVDVARDATGAIAETYPAGSLRCWGLASVRYKGRSNLAALDAAVDAVLATAPWLDLGPHTDVLRRSDDAFDAVVAALAARAVATARSEAPPPQLRAAARAEGWIALPTCPLGELALTPPRPPAVA